MIDLLTEDQSPQDRLGNPNQDPTNYLQELVGPNAKFKDNESLAKGKWESDKYVKTLEMKLDEYRTDIMTLQRENEKRATLEELMDQIRRQPQSRDEPEVRVEPKPYKPDPKELGDLVESKLNELERSRTAQQNINEVRIKLKERFGSEYQSKLKQHLDDLDIPADYINDLASRSPKAALRTLGLDQPEFKPDTFGAPRTQNTFKPNPPEKRTWSWYQKLKQTNPAEYRSAKTNVQMHNDMMTLGEDFMDGDYYVSGLHERGDVSPVMPATTHFR